MNPIRLALVAALGIASIASGQNPPPPTDVYLVRLDRPGERVVNITNRAGYDNQPAFLGLSSYIVWTSQRGGQTDIHGFLKDGPIQYTNTPESEYSAAITPDGKSFAVVRVEMDSTQRLWQFPIFGGTPSVVLADIKPVGYFAYLDSTTLALFVLGNPNALQIADTRTGKGTVVTTRIGRSLQHVPGGRKASFTQRAGDKTLLKTVDPTPRSDGSFAVDTVATLPDSAEYVVWRSPTNVITGAGSRLMHMRLPERSWITLADLSAQGIRRISRLAISPDGNTIALVAEEPRP